jgi:hypothetical protein
MIPVMPEKEIFRVLNTLTEEIQALREDVTALKENQAVGFSEILGMLRRRGLTPFRKNPSHHLFFPPSSSEENKTQFYDLFKKYSFRLFLREILKRKGVFRVAEVARFNSQETGRKYVQCLIGLGLAESVQGRSFRLWAVPTLSLGPTLEWFMAEILRREFFCPTLYGLRCKGSHYGGDYDVLASLEGKLLYVEVKSSPPKNIEGDEIREFLSRLPDLIPHLALFFVDTELRLKDKIVPFFEAERLAQAFGRRAKMPPVQRIAEEIFYSPPQVYLLSSKPSIPANLAACFRHHFTFAPDSLGSDWSREVHSH